MTAKLDDLRYWYEMGYFYGRNDQLDGKPYDARTPLERATAPLHPPAETHKCCAGAQCTRNGPDEGATA